MSAAIFSELVSMNSRVEGIRTIDSQEKSIVNRVVKSLG